MSEQMTVVLPRVSTAGIFRIMALRCAILLTPMASIIVIAAGKPSGIAPTARATAAIKVASGGSPCSQPASRVKTARVKMAQSSIPLNASRHRRSHFTGRS